MLCTYQSSRGMTSSAVPVSIGAPVGTRWPVTVALGSGIPSAARIRWLNGSWSLCTITRSGSSLDRPNVTGLG